MNRYFLAAICFTALVLISDSLFAYEWKQCSITGYYYSLTSTAKTWQNAEAEAQGLGGHLVTIRSQSENDWLKSNFTQSNLWIGLYQPSGSSEPAGGWTWISGENTSYRNWIAGEPSNSDAGENHAEINHAHFIGQWNDEPDSTLQYGIIEVANTSGLVAYWKFNEGSGTTAADSSGNLHNGTICGAAWDYGILNKALKYDGIDDYVSFGNSGFPSYLWNGDFSVSLWIYPTSISSGDQYIIWFGTSDGMIYIKNSAVTFRFWDGSGHQVQTTSLSNNSWYHVVVTRSKIYGMKIFLNEELVDSNVYNANANSLAQDTRIGDRDNQGQYDFHGIIDEVRIYNRMLSSSEITDLYHQPCPEQNTSLPVQPQYELLPAELSGCDNLVLITHGWNGPFGNSDHRWIDEMDSKFQTYFETNNMNDTWKAYAYHWGEYSGGLPFAEQSKGEAEKIGVKLGEQIVTFTNCKHVHLIAHSAGGWMIHNISQVIKQSRPDISIQITFIDAYTPKGKVGVNSLGCYSDWSEHYVDDRGEVGISFDEIDVSVSKSTNATLKEAYNIDVTGMDPDFAKLGWDAHGWPHEWYLSTIPTNQPSSRAWGFASSLESGVIPGLEIMQQTFPRGEREDYHIFEYSLPPIDHVYEMAHNPTYWGTYVPNYSSSDDIYIEGTKFTLVSGELISPQQMLTTATESTSLTPSDISWMSVMLDVNEPANALSFDCEFASSSGRQGILEVYWKDELIGSVDERYAFAGTQNYIYLLPKLYQSGQHKLAFKLAVFNDTASSLSINNFRLIFYTPSYNLCLDDKIDIKDIAILIEAWLDRRIPQDIAPENGDGIVNLYDFAALAQTWEDNQNGMQSLAELNHNWLATWHYNADINRDGVINLLDFTVLAEHWLDEVE
jgi:hypothetical protein